MAPVDHETAAVLESLVEGKVQRSRHDLRLDGRDLTEAFAEVLRRKGYTAVRIRDLRLRPGIRHPAWVLRDGEAFFGYVFLEKFEEGSYRPLFGSVVRDGRGDWRVLLTRSSRERVFVKAEEALPFDEDRPSPGR